MKNEKSSDPVNVRRFDDFSADFPNESVRNMNCKEELFFSMLPQFFQIGNKKLADIRFPVQKKHEKIYSEKENS